MACRMASVPHPLATTESWCQIGGSHENVVVDDREAEGCGRRGSRDDAPSAETMPFEPGSFDLVCSFATFEHVPPIELAFREIERVLASGGKAYTAAAPLPPVGTTLGVRLRLLPWAHLRLSTEKLVDLAARKVADIAEAQIRYLLSEGVGGVPATA